MPSTRQQQSFPQPAATDKPFSIDGLCSIVFATFRNADADILCITAGPNQQQKAGCSAGSWQNPGLNRR
jgi:hypothetical protein